MARQILLSCSSSIYSEPVTPDYNFRGQFLGGRKHGVVSPNINPIVETGKYIPPVKPLQLGGNCQQFTLKPHPNVPSWTGTYVAEVCS